MQDLVNLLRERSSAAKDLPALTFEGADPGVHASLTYAGLDRRARVIAARLQEKLDPGDRALLLFQPGLEFVVAFFGCLYAGVIAVPVYPPGSSRGLGRLLSVLRDAAPRCVLGESAHRGRLEKLFSQVAEAARLSWLSTDEGSDEDAAAWVEPDLSGDAIAFLQYTSGSTSAPKGVMVGHRHLLHNEEMIRRAFRQDRSSVIVGWLPLYHDMGLIGNVLQPLYLGARSILLSPIDFLRQPYRWLETIHRHRATTSGGPNFAYELCLRKISDEQLAGLDLSTWRVAFNGAEPIRAATLERFGERFAAAGFDRKAFYPCYGLAEATLFVTGGEAGEGARTRRLAKAALEKDRAEPVVDADEESLRLVGCGRAWSGQEVAIVDPDSHRRLPDGTVGEIWVHGPSVAGGYWRQPEASAETFGGALAGEEPGRAYLRTGDLGFLDEGGLFVTGRLKDLIILRGRNHYPQDLELTAVGAHPDARPGCTAAFSVPVDGEERLVIVQEAQRRPTASPQELAEALRQQVSEEHQVAVHAVVVVRAGGVPKTSSGKIRRQPCRSLYLRGELPVLEEVAAAAPEAGEIAAGDIASEEIRVSPEELALLRTLPLEARVEALLPGLRRTVATAARLDPQALRDDLSLSALGVDSLAAVDLQERLARSLGAEVGLGELLEAESLRQAALAVAHRLDAPAEAPVAAPASAASTEPPRRLSPEQRSLWFLQRLSPESAAYTLALRCRLHAAGGGAVRLQALSKALEDLIQRHPWLGAAFPDRGGEPGVELERGRGVEVELFDAAGWEAAVLREYLERRAARPFALHREPPLRVAVYLLADGSPILALEVHHLVVDLEALALLAGELSVLYRQRAAGGPAPSPALPPAPAVGELGRLVEERWEDLESPRATAAIRYWEETLADLPAPLDLPVDRPRGVDPQEEGDSVARVLRPGLLSAVEAFAGRQGVTVSAALLAVFAALCRRLTGQDDLVLGSPASLRGGWTASLVTYQVNPVALRLRGLGDAIWGEVARRAHHATVGALDHRRLPFAAVVEALGVERRPGRTPLFDVLFSHQVPRRRGAEDAAAFQFGLPGARLVPGGPRAGGLVYESLAQRRRRVGFDLSLLTSTVGGELAACLEHRALFDRTTARRWLAAFEGLLAGALAEPDRPLDELPWLSPAQRQQVAREWALGRVPESAASALPARVVAAAQARPEAIAVVNDEGAWSYGALLRTAARLARELRHHGVGRRPGREDRVAVLAGRSPEYVAAVLGCWLAGAAYLPLDPAYPLRRRRWMMEDAAVRALVAHPDEPTAGMLPGAATEIPILSAALAPAAAEAWTEATPDPDPQSPTYVIYTSGSTGRPKGVVVSHGGLSHLMRWHLRAFPLAPGDRTSFVAGPAFDVSAWEIWPTLLAGGTLLIPPEEARAEAGALLGWLGEKRADVAFVPTAVAEDAFARRQEAPGPPLVLTAGDRLRRFPRVGDARRLVNAYGPTEATVIATWGTVPPAGSPAAAPSIGRAVDGSTAAVVDAHHRPQPPGVAGELVLGGDGLARGYLGRPALTALRFVPDSLPGAAAGGRLYRTGDRVRWRADGEIDFLGRFDKQVQIRGHRVELGEVEATLEALAGVEQARVLALPGPRGPRLVAYWTPGSSRPSEDLARRLRAELPEPMIPSAFVELESFPLTPNGKLDLAALPTPEAAEAAPEGAAPTTWAERQVADCMARVLEIPGPLSRQADFFELGGHSLVATRLAFELQGMSGAELPVAAVFRSPRLADLALEVEAAVAAGSGRPLEPRGPGEAAPATSNQIRMWLLEKLGTPAGVYTLPLVLELRGDLSQGGLERAYGALLERHPALRTVLRAGAGQEPMAPVQQPVFQRVLAAEPTLPVVDLAGLPPSLAGDVGQRLVEAHARRFFDLEEGPVIRPLLVSQGGESALLALSLHHMAVDGWSVPILLRDLGALYEAPAPALPGLSVDYGDYGAWMARRLAANELADSLEVWLRRLRDASTRLELPADRPAPARRHFTGRALSLPLDETLVAGVEELARRQGVTPYVVLVASFQAWLGRLSGQRDLLVGAPVANRPHAALAEVVGFFANTVALRAALPKGGSFGELVEAAGEVCREAQRHQELPFESVVEALRPERSLSHNPLFQTLFDFRDERRIPSLGDLATRLLDVETGTAKFDLLLAVVARPEGWRGRLEISDERFDAATGERFLGYWRTLLAAAVAAPERALDEHSLLEAAQREQLLREWSGGNRSLDRAPASTLDGLFFATAAARPEARALRRGATVWSYGELARRVEATAAALAAAGIGGEDRVALFLPRGPEMVAAMLGVLAAGAAYVPVDPAYPAERRAFLLEDSGARRVLVDESTRDRLPGTAPPTLEVDTLPDGGAPPRREADPRSLAYLIYTSGSTGRPKGVAITHGSAVARVEWARRAFSAEERAGVLAVTSICFDLSVFEILVTLALGGTVLLTEDALELISEPAVGEGATLLNTVPSAAESLLQAGTLPATLKAVNLAGEPLRQGLAQRLHASAQVRLLNLYGPSEDTTYSTLSEVSAGATGEPTIGKPLPGTRAYVVDDALRPLPPGLPGELMLSGAGLARGYHARGGLTAGRFLPDPFAEGPGERLYRTGDRVRWSATGELEFLGRTDQQVKLRGFRIELGEISAVAAEEDGVREAAAVIGEDGAAGRFLLLFVEGEAELEPEAAAALAAALDRRLEARLPAAMRPSRIVVEALPRTANGKVDRRSLARLPLARLPLADTALVETHDSPRSATEEAVAAVWAEVLGVGEVPADADFFRLGGHSLLAVAATARLSEAWGFEVPLPTLFERPTVRRLAAWLDGERSEGAARLEAITPRDPAAGDLLSFAEERLWFLQMLDPESPIYNMSASVEVDGDLVVAALARALEQAVERHGVLRSRYAEGEDGLPRVAPLAAAEEAAVAALPVVDLQGLEPADRLAAVEALERREAATPVDLGRGPLLRCRLLRLREPQHRLLLTVHHIAFDGESMRVLLADVDAFYRGVRAGLPPGEGPGIQYRDYAAWQRRHLDESALEEGLAYWREALKEAPAILELPLDRPRGAVRSAVGAVLPMRLGKKADAAVAELARRAGCTPFVVLTAALQLLLARWADSPRLTLGVPVANRPRREMERLVGLFVNTVVLPADLGGGPTVSEHLARTRRAAIGAFAHQQLPFEVLVDALSEGRDLSRNPLFQVLFVLQDAAARRAALGDLDVTLRSLHGGTSRLDLTLGLVGEERDGGTVYTGELEYASDLFDRATVVRWAGHLSHLLEAAAAAPQAPLVTLSLLAAGERQQLLREWARPSFEETWPEDATLADLFAAQARRTPSRVALRGAAGEWTYAELAARVEAVRRALLAAGLSHEDRVAVLAGRSFEMVAALLGVLRAGGAYVPVDPAYPRRRIAFMIADSAARWVLADAAGRQRLPEDAPPVIDLGEVARPGESPDEATTALPGGLAYVIYTSGSTGRPKGVAIEHGSALQMLAWATRTFSEEEASVVLASTSTSFDLSIFEIFMPLSRGATVQLVDNVLTLAEATDSAAGPTLLNTVPSAAAELLQLDALPETLAAVCLAGEPLRGDLARRIHQRLPSARLWNLYGPSEDTTYSTAAEIPAGDGREPSIGRPLPGSAAYVLDSGGRPTPVGVPGLLWLGGAGLARGYLGRPALTAQRFRPDGLSGESGGRLYDTGDRTRWRGDGELEFLGRDDHQVKLRGFRIELGEVEAAAQRLPGVENAVAVADPEAGRLALFYQAQGAPEPTPEEVAEYLAAQLPAPMRPGLVQAVSSFARTPSGKIDRRALPAFEAAAPAAALVEPRTPLEAEILEVFNEVLGGDLGIEDDFFARGGHSLLAARAAARMRLRFGLPELSIQQLFLTPTVAALAPVITEMQAQTLDQSEVSDLIDQIRDLSPEELSRMLSEAPD